MEPGQKRSSGTRFGVAAKPPQRVGLFERLLHRNRPTSALAVDYREMEQEVRRAVSGSETLKVVSEGRLHKRRILVIDHDTVHLELRRDSITATSDIGKIVAIRAGATQFVRDVFVNMGRISEPFRKLHTEGTIQYDPNSCRFLVHVVDKFRAQEVRLQLPEPYKSFFILGVAKSNRHSANEAITRVIRECYPRVEVTGVFKVQSTIQDAQELSIATVSKSDGLHVSIHERPSYVADTNAQKPEDRVGATVFFIESRLNRRFISALRALHVKKLYLLTTTGLEKRTEIDLETAEHDLQFRATDD
ncbi:MAG: hypothetical protein ABH842_06355 [Candidatus Micrarchaeota archaeon]